MPDSGAMAFPSSGLDHHCPLRRGQADRVQKCSILFHPEAIVRSKAVLSERFAHNEAGFAAEDAGAALGVSRTFSIPLLEHLDAVRFTHRAGDRRNLVPMRPEER